MSIEGKTNFETINKLTDLMLKNSMEIGHKVGVFKCRITGQNSVGKSPSIKEMNEKQDREANMTGWLEIHAEKLEEIFDRLCNIYGDISDIRCEFGMDKDMPEVVEKTQQERR